VNGDAAARFALDRRIVWRAFWIVLVFFPVVGVINALSLITDAGRAGIALDPREPFILELTSMAGILIAFPFVARLERRMPLTAETWKPALAVYALGSIVFCALHVGVMVLLREAAFPLLLGRDYSFFDDLLRDSLYEYRKDILPYAAMVAVLGLIRQLEEGRLEAATARADARDTGRLTLKSGGRTVWLDARSLDWAEAAGNYVEVRASGKTHLARISLSALAEQLGAAGVDIVRIHRSRIVNRAKVSEIVPSGDGDFRLKMSDGSELRGSRRYRQALEH
jgi:DNA-binding LytR/AlgR family response regulator